MFPSMSRVCAVRVTCISVLPPGNNVPLAAQNLTACLDGEKYSLGINPCLIRLTSAPVSTIALMVNSSPVARVTKNKIFRFDLLEEGWVRVVKMRGGRVMSIGGTI